MASTTSDARGPRPGLRARRLPGPFSHFRTHLRAVAGAGVVSASSVFAESAALVLIVPLADVVAAGGSDTFAGDVGPFSITASTGQLVVVIVAALAISVAAKLATAAILSRAVASWELQQRARIIDAYLAADFELQSREPPGALQEITGQHVTRAANAMQALGRSVNAGVSIAVLLGSALVIQPVVALGLVGAGALLALLLRPVSRRVRGASQVVVVENTRTGGHVADTASAARDIKVFDAGSHFASLVVGAARRIAGARRRSLFLAQAYPALYQGTGILFVVGALGLAATRSSADLPALGAVAVLLLRSLSYAQQLTSMQQMLNQTVPFAEDLGAAMERYESRRARYGTAEVGPVDAVELRDVSYSYGPDTPALRDVSLELPRSGIVGLVGPSGSGKSTLAALLLRLRRPTAGRVLVDDRDVDEYAPSSWSTAVTLVPQEARLVRGTVHDNVAYFRAVPREAVVDAARAVGLDETFRALPQGYDTELGESVHDLSGGQRQRVGIARALVARPRIVVLDEPTSALDTATEEWIRRTLSELRETTLVIIITHRESTLSLCDSVVTLQGGRSTSTSPAPGPARERARGRG